MARGNRSRYYRAQTRARVRRRRPRGGSVPWNVGIVAIIVVGVLAVVVARSANNGGAIKGRAVGDHWHAALGVSVCGQWLPNPPETQHDAQGQIVRFGTDVFAGLHTHGDGLIHFEPQTSDDAGRNATVGRFFRYNGWKLSTDSFTFEGVGERNGERCPAVAGEPGGAGHVEWAVNGKERRGDPAAYAPGNLDRVVIAFVAPGGKRAAALGDPPSTPALAHASGTEGPPTAPPANGSAPPAPAPSPSAPTAPPPSPSRP